MHPRALWEILHPPAGAKGYPDLTIKIEMLRCFRTVADHGSLADAAEALGRTPSAISMMLRQFEDHVGAPLFESARKSRLTPLGELIRAEAARELKHFERTVAAIEGLSRAELGTVRLAATPSVAQTVLPPVLQGYLRNYPRVRVEMMDADSDTVQRELAADRADIGLASIPRMPGFNRRALFSDAYGVICRAGHPLARRPGGQVVWADLADVDFIANGLLLHIRDEGFLPILRASRLMVRNTVSILGLVRAGVGVTLLPELALPGDFDDLKFLPVTDSTARREVWMVTPPEHMLTPAARALARAIAATDICAGLGKLQHP